MKSLTVKLIRLYQSTISRVTLSSCRYVPTCSQYACDALERYGFLKGCWLTFLRIMRCNPWSHGGYDPVP